MIFGIDIHMIHMSINAKNPAQTFFYSSITDKYYYKKSDFGMNTYMDHKSIHSKIPPWIILFGQNQQIFSQKISENFCINFSSVMEIVS